MLGCSAGGRTGAERDAGADAAVFTNSNYGRCGPAS